MAKSQSYLTGISADRYADDIVIRSYAIAEDGTVYYGEAISVSVFEVANAVDNANTVDGSAPTEADTNAFYSFVSEATEAEYKTWCDDNSKAVGTLYKTRYEA